MFQIGTIIPMVLTNVFQSFSLFLVFVFTLFPAVIMNVAPFSAYKTHTTRNSSHYLKFTCTIFIDKNSPIPRSSTHLVNINQSTHLVNINHMHSLNMNHLYFLHFPTIFNHFENSFLFFMKAALFIETIFS